MDNLAVIFSKQNKHNEAEKLQNESLQIKRNIMPADNSEIAISLTNLSITLSLQNKIKEAVNYQRECLGIYQRVYQ
jgi:hypothetical protein